MDIKASMKPGQNGTKRLQEKYGDRLVCVRYRYNKEAGKRYTTVELIEDEKQWAPLEPPQTTRQTGTESQPIGVRIEYWETDLRERVKAYGGLWRPRQKLWEMDYASVVALGLESRCVAQDGGDSE